MLITAGLQALIFQRRNRPLATIFTDFPCSGDVIHPQLRLEGLSTRDFMSRLCENSLQVIIHNTNSVKFDHYGTYKKSQKSIRKRTVTDNIR